MGALDDFANVKIVFERVIGYDQNQQPQTETIELDAVVSVASGNTGKQRLNQNQNAQDELLSTYLGHITTSPWEDRLSREVVVIFAHDRREKLLMMYPPPSAYYDEEDVLGIPILLKK